MAQETLESLYQMLPEQEESPVAEVDVTEFFGTKEPVIFKYKEPDIARVFQVPVDAQKLEKKYPEWPEPLRQTIAVLAISHIAPAPGNVPVGIMYAMFAEKNKRLFTKLATAFGKAFPQLSNINDAIFEEKKDCEDTDASTGSLLNTPEEGSPAS